MRTCRSSSIGQQFIEQDIQEEGRVDLRILRVQRAPRQYTFGKRQRDLVRREQKIAADEQIDLVRLHTIGVALQAGQDDGHKEMIAKDIQARTPPV